MKIIPKFLGMTLGIVMMAGLQSCHHNSVDPLASNDATPVLKIPGHFPPVVYNLQHFPITQEKIELGRQLFFDPVLSSDRTVSCASCHHPEAAFSDPGMPKSIGVQGRVGKRNSQALFNLLWQPHFMWDGGVTHLNLVPLVPITDHFEMDLPWPDAIERINQSTDYVAKFQNAFNINRQVQDQEVFQVFAAFMGSMVSSDSKYDRVIQGKENFSSEELNGYMIFKRNCSGCHQEPLLTDHSFRNNGLDTLFANEGRMHITGNMADLGKFKVPSLRNVALTYPYMHDGRFQTLDQVVEHYVSGVKASATLDSLLSPNFRARLRSISHNEKEDLIKFLHTLTDHKFVNDPNLRQP